MALPITGDSASGKSISTIPLALGLPVVLKSNLADATHPLNDERTGGKKPGGVYLAREVGAGGGQDVYTLVTAKGTTTTDPWVTVSAFTGAGATLAPVVYVTPT